MSTIAALGGKGSGNFGHKGRPGEVGGSASSDEDDDPFGIGHSGRGFPESEVVELLADEWASEFAQEYGSALDLWMSAENKQKLHAIVQAGGKVRSASTDMRIHGSDDKERYQTWADNKAAKMTRAGFKLFDEEHSGDSHELIFVKKGSGKMKGLEHRDLHVLAGGTPRVEKLHGRDHLVVPVVALMEGVIHAINADTPEFVSTGVLSSAAHTFNGRPLVLGHPVQNGRQISANSPGVVERQGFGTIYESKTTGSRLGMEAWIDPVRLEALNQQDLLARVRAGKPIEVSVGAYVKTNGRTGLHNGRRFANEWSEVQGDHLAFLPNGRGACSLEMGCGACRMASEKPTLYSLEGAEPVALGGPGSGNFGHAGRPGQIGGSASSTEGGGGSGSSSSDGEENEGAISRSTIESIIGAPFAPGTERTIGNKTSVLKRVSGKAKERREIGEKLIAKGFRKYAGRTKSEDAYSTPDQKSIVSVKQSKYDLLVEYIRTAEAVFLSALSIDPLEAEVEELRTAIGSRNNVADRQRIQDMHDACVELGAECGHYKLRENSDIRTATIKNEGGKYVLYTRDGSRKLGTHDTRAEAEAQEKAIEAAKRRRSAELAGDAVVEEHKCSCKGKH